MPNLSKVCSKTKICDDENKTQNTSQWSNLLMNHELEAVGLGF